MAKTYEEATRGQSRGERAVGHEWAVLGGCRYRVTRYSSFAIVAEEERGGNGGPSAPSGLLYRRFDKEYTPVTMSAAELVRKARRGGAAPAVAPEGKARSVMDSCPVVDAFAALGEQEGAGDRDGATMLFFRFDGRWKVCLSDRQEGQSLWGEGWSLEGAIINLESRMESGAAEWRRDKKRPGGKK